MPPLWRNSFFCIIFTPRNLRLKFESAKNQILLKVSSQEELIPWSSLGLNHSSSGPSLFPFYPILTEPAGGRASASGWGLVTSKVGCPEAHSQKKATLSARLLDRPGHAGGRGERRGSILSHPLSGFASVSNEGCRLPGQTAVWALYGLFVHHSHRCALHTVTWHPWQAPRPTPPTNTDTTSPSLWVSTW